MRRCDGEWSRVIEYGKNRWIYHGLFEQEHSHSDRVDMGEESTTGADVGSQGHFSPHGMRLRCYLIRNMEMWSMES